MFKNEFPKEFYLELTNNDNLLARVVVNKSNKDFHYEIDIVFKESKKIFRHIGREYGLDDERDALDQAVIQAEPLFKLLKKLERHNTNYDSRRVSQKNNTSTFMFNV